MARKRKRKRRSKRSMSPQAREGIYQSGLSYFREGEYEQAIRAWDRIVKYSEPGLAEQLAEAHFRNAISKYESDDMKTVISELHSALKYETPNQPTYLFHIGLAYHRMEKLPQAISFYMYATQAAPEVERYKYHLGLAYLQNGEIQESIKVFEAMRGTNGRMGEILAYISQGNYERALEILSAVHDRDNGKFSFLEGLIYLKQGNNREAKRFLKSAANDETKNGVSDYYLGVAHIRTDAMPSAISAWENASQKGFDIGFMKDDMANIYRLLAARYFDREDLSKVVKIWEKLMELEPEDDQVRRNLVHAYFLRANEYAKTEQITYAIRYWQKAWELDSSNADIAHNLALAYERRNQLKEAAEYWKAAVNGWKQQMSGHPGQKEILEARMHTVHVHLADIALKTNGIGRAIAECRQALRYAPDEVGTIVKLADLQMMQQNGDKAIKLLSRAQRISPKDTDILQMLSIAYAMKGDLNRSVECMKDILNIDPANQLYREIVGDYYLSRAEDALETKRYTIALDFLDEGLEICPGNIELQAFVGAVYLDMGKRSEAEAAFQETIGLADSTDPVKPYILAAHHYLDRRMIDAAEVYFAKITERNPDDPLVYINIAREYCSFDICRQALEYFEKAKKVKPGDASVLTAIVEVLMDHECPKYGVQYAEELMDADPRDPMSYFFLGLAYHFAGMDDEAMDILIQGTEVAEETGNDEMIDEIEVLYSYIEFENVYGNSLDRVSEQLMDAIGDIGRW